MTSLQKKLSKSNLKLTLSNRYESFSDYDISERNDDIIVTKVSHLPPHPLQKNMPLRKT